MNLQCKPVLFVLFFHPTTPEKWLRTVFLNAQYDGGSVINSIALQEVGWFANLSTYSWLDRSVNLNWLETFCHNKNCVIVNWIPASVLTYKTTQPNMIRSEEASHLLKPFILLHKHSSDSDHVNTDDNDNLHIICWMVFTVEHGFITEEWNGFIVGKHSELSGCWETNTKHKLEDLHLLVLHFCI